MKKIIRSVIYFSIFCSIHFADSQNIFKAIINDSASSEPLPGVSVAVLSTTLSGTTDANGLVTITNIPNGKQNIVFFSIGYKKVIVTVDFPSGSNKILNVKLASELTNLDEVIVSSSRTNSRLEDLPAKVEVLGQEDMDEESTIVPGNVSSILGDLSIITIQRTNQVNGNDAIRMQGLDSKYTQIMRDGLPLFDGFSGSLGVLSIPPLDLKQVEIIKGSASTLYGGGAIGGLINFISKTPVDTRQAVVTANVTNLKETNLNVFASGKKKKIGYTLFAGGNMKQPKDINGDGFAEVASDKNFILHPRLFLYPSDKTEINIGVSSNYDTKIGGDIDAIMNGVSPFHPYLQTETTFRNTLDFSLVTSPSASNTFTFKTAGSSFDREMKVTGYVFQGTQYSTYTEVNDLIKRKKHTIVVGLNFISENFVPVKLNTRLVDYNYYTAGSFLQDDWQVVQKLTIQLGARYDYHFTFGSFFLPRISFLYKPSPKFTIRLAGGTGYKTPNIFDLSEPTPILNPVSANVKSENSMGINADISYHTLLFDALNVQVDQAFYTTTITNPVILTTDTAVNSYAVNGNYEVNSYGTDTYIRLSYEDVELYLGYNHTEAVQQYDAATLNMPFNPKDKFSSTLAYEIENKWRMGIEASYTANQYIYNNKKVNDILFMAAMVERKFKFGSIVINCENLLDNRQSDYESLVDGTRQNPVFKPVWASLEGRVINLSVKWKL